MSRDGKIMATMRKNAAQRTYWAIDRLDPNRAPSRVIRGCIYTVCRQATGINIIYVYVRYIGARARSWNQYLLAAWPRDVAEYSGRMQVELLVNLARYRVKQLASTRAPRYTYKYRYYRIGELQARSCTGSLQQILRRSYWISLR